MSIQEDHNCGSCNDDFDYLNYSNLKTYCNSCFDELTEEVRRLTFEQDELRRLRGCLEFAFVEKGVYMDMPELASLIAKVEGMIIKRIDS